MGLLQRLYEIFFPLPAVCPICLQRQERLQVCAACEAKALRKRSLEGQCQRCHSFGIKSEACQSCRQWPVYLLGNRAIWPYEDDWQQVILDFKFRNKPWLAEALAAELLPVLPTNFDLLVPGAAASQPFTGTGLQSECAVGQSAGRAKRDAVAGVLAASAGYAPSNRLKPQPTVKKSGRCFRAA